jgi:hypothetical protein
MFARANCPWGACWLISVRGRDEPKAPAPSAKVFDRPKRVTYGTEILTPGIRLLR